MWNAMVAKFEAWFNEMWMRGHGYGTGAGHRKCACHQSHWKDTSEVWSR